MSYTWAPYDAAHTCNQKPQGAKALAAYLELAFPYQSSMGICNCRNTRGGSSKSHHAECRAYDAGVPVKPNGAARPELGDPIHQLLGPHGKRLGLDHLIYNRIIYSARSPDGRPYKGTHPHYNHHHIGLNTKAALNLNYATLVAVLGDPGGITPPPQGDDMSFLPMMDGDGLSRGRLDKADDVTVLQDLLGFTGSDKDGKYGAGTSAGVAPFSGDDGKVCSGETYGKIQRAALGGGGAHGHPEYLTDVQAIKGG